MKKSFYLFFLLFSINPSIGQEFGFFDYKDGRTIEIDGTTYLIGNRFEEKLDRFEYIFVEMWNAANKTEDGICGEYLDGTTTCEPNDVSGIVIPREDYRRTIYNALRKAFTKTEIEEMSRYLNARISADVFVDASGKIQETRFAFYIYRDFVIQPEKIAVIDRELKKNLQFEVDAAKAGKFTFFRSAVHMPLSYYTNYMVEIELPYGGGLTPVDGKPAARP